MKNIYKLAIMLLNTAITAEKNKLIQQNSINDENVLAKEYSNIGSSFSRLKKYHEAIENFDIAIKYNPSYASEHIIVKE
ncbi:tetratricopeptide repeat protein [Orientia tsutsugamushi]|uniref:TPR repeat family protein n=1 Tax=Orientia tsutsugamushi str. TA716 TaxID=1359175 RepID=A0A0F3P7W5_ORITS|nr:tetratricopeptide repeat protein [Orientia tsutsugamushi]KJV76435.1 TPR repeat family protein [Orientia tsutsugamushi str. TA716]